MFLNFMFQCLKTTKLLRKIASKIYLKNYERTPTLFLAREVRRTVRTLIDKSRKEKSL